MVSSSGASRTAQQARHSDVLKHGARLGLVSYGIVHLLIAWLALQVAWSGSGGDASSGGALTTLAEQPFGRAMLWITVLGLVALALWQLTTAVWGHGSEEKAKRVRKRLGAAGRVVVYAALAVSAVKIASGSGASGGDSKEEGLTADLLGAPAGRVLVAAVGITILVVAGRQVHRGVTDSFTHDLHAEATSGDSGRLVLAVGRFGYVAKGIAIGVVGILFGWAALSYDPDKAGGLDDALKTVREQPFGPYLLTFVALGFASFGAFCFAWAKYARTR